MFQYNPLSGTFDLVQGEGGPLDDVLDFDNFSSLPVPGEEGKLYVDRSLGTLWRWNGANYAPVPAVHDGGTY